MAKIKNIDAVKRLIEEKLKDAVKDRDASVTVGYQTNYAIYVHEVLDSVHPVGQAKFLEQPAREYKNEIARLIREAWLRGANMLSCLMIGGRRLQRESMKLVPIKTGNLKRSCETRPD